MPVVATYRTRGAMDAIRQPVALRIAPPSAARPTGALAADCRHYRGDRPCIENQLCTGCASYDPPAHRFVIIKLGALGDVIRTLSLLPTLHRRWSNAHVTWVSSEAGCRMIDNHPQIDRVLPFSPVTSMVLAHQRFDTVVSLDKEPEPCALAMSLRADTKLGIGMSDWGTPVPLNAECEPYFHLGLSDELKFERNNKTYPRLVHEALGWPYDGGRYDLPIDGEAASAVGWRLAALGWSRAQPTVGINVGAGKAFANKMWPARKTARLIKLLKARQPDLQVLLLGGPAERPIIDRILSDQAVGGLHGVIDAGNVPVDVAREALSAERAFVALVDRCDTLFTGDTMAMHVAVARRVPVVALFGPTCEQEIDLFGRGEKFIARVDCGPCYKRVCDQHDRCVEAIGEEELCHGIERVLAGGRRAAGQADAPAAAREDARRAA